MDDGGEWRAFAAGATCAVMVALGNFWAVSSESPSDWEALAFMAALAVAGYLGRNGWVVAVPLIVGVLLYPLFASEYAAANDAHEPFPPWVGLGYLAATDALAVGVGFIVWQVVRYRRSQGRSANDAD